MSNEVTKARNKFLRTTLTAFKNSTRNVVLALNNHEERISVLKQQLTDYGITLDDFETWVRLTQGEQLDLFGDMAVVESGVARKALSEYGLLALAEEMQRRGVKDPLAIPALAQLHLATTEELLNELKLRHVNDAREISGNWSHELGAMPPALLAESEIAVVADVVLEHGPGKVMINGKPIEFAPLPSTERALEDSMRAILNSPADDNDEEEQDVERADSEPESVVADFVDGDVNDADLEQRAGVYDYFEADGG
jgi:hypothetical protein